MNEVLYVIELWLNSLTWKDAAIVCLAVVVVILLFRLFKAKQDKIEEYLEEKQIELSNAFFWLKENRFIQS